jgi:PAT family acetyl-CoA transporter-like MFS transporter 1
MKALLRSGLTSQPIVLKGVDFLTKSTCFAPDEKTNLLRAVGECVSESGKLHCSQVLGECVLQRDGYYPMSMICVGLGAALLVTFIIPTTRKLQCEFDLLVIVCELD